MRRCPYCGRRQHPSDQVAEALLWAGVFFASLGGLLAIRLFT